MRRGAGGTSDAVQVFSPWITWFGWLCSSEASVVRNIAGGKTGDDQSVFCYPLIIQYSYAGSFYFFYVGVVHHPLVIAEGEKGRGDGGAGAEEGENVGLGSHRTRIIFRPGSVQHISCDADEGRSVSTEGGNDRRGIRIVQITQQRQGS